MENSTQKLQTKDPTVLFIIDYHNRTEEVVLKDCSEKISVGPFEGEFSISGDYNLLNKKGKMDCELSLEKPFAMNQKLLLTDSVLKLKHKTNILKVLQSFAIPAQGELNKYFDIQVDLELNIQLIDKDFTCIGSAKSSKYKFSIFQKEFGINQIGFYISRKNNQFYKQVQLSLLVAQIPIKLVHSFGGKYLLEAYVQVFPFGKIIQNLTDGFDDTFNIFSVLEKIQFKKNELKFKNFSNLSIKSECEIGICDTSITNGKFSTSMAPLKDFKFNKIHNILSFLDGLNLDKLNISLSNSRGLTIEGFLPIFKNEVLVKLCQVLYSTNNHNVKGIPFSLIVMGWKDITVKIAFLKDLRINQSILFKQLDLIIEAAVPPAFKVQGQLDVTICGNPFIFKMSCKISTTITLAAELDGTWNEPFGLKNTYVKDLLLSIGLNNFAVAGQIKIGEMTAQAAVSFDQVNPKKNMIFFDLKAFQLVKILSVFHVDLPQEIAKILNIVKINEMKVEMVPPGGVQLGSKFYEEGFSALLDCEIFGTKAHLQLKYHNKSLSFNGSLSQIEIENFLSITDFKQTGKGPSFDVLLAPSAKAHFKMQGHLKIASILQTSVLASVDAQGLVFEAHMGISFLQMFGLPFMQGSFKLYAGFLRKTGKFKIQASYSTSNKDMKLFARELLKLIQQPLNKIKDAQDKLTQVQNQLTEAQNNLSIKQNIYKNKIENSKNQYDKATQHFIAQANAKLEREKQRASNQLNQEKQRATYKLEQAQAQANSEMQAEKWSATKKLQSQRNSANHILQKDRNNLQGHLEYAKNKVADLNNNIRQLEAKQHWYNYVFMQIAIASVKVAKEIAQGVLNGVQSALKGSLWAVEKTYDGLLQAAESTYKGMIGIAEGACKISIEAASKTYVGLINAADKTYGQMIAVSQATFDQTMQAVKLVGDKAVSAYIGAVDLAYTIANNALEVAKAGVEVAKTGLEGIRQTLKYAVDIAIEIAKDIREALIINNIFFQFSFNSFDILDETYALIKIDVVLVGKQIKAQFKISLKDIVNIALHIVNTIWNSIKGLFT